jgi:hypothetical protein
MKVRRKLSQKQRRILLAATLAIYFIAYVVPIIGMITCNSSVDGTPKSCPIGGPLLLFFAQFGYSLFLVSAFTLFLPLVIYMFVVQILNTFVRRQLERQFTDA